VAVEGYYLLYLWRSKQDALGWLFGWYFGAFYFLIDDCFVKQPIRRLLSGYKTYK
jgi:hypothetical protein